MKSTAWCVVWFGFPNEDWIHPWSLTVCRVGYAALQPVSMEILRSCSVPTPHPPPPPSSAVHSYGDLGQGVFVCVHTIQQCVRSHKHAFLMPLW